MMAFELFDPKEEFVVRQGKLPHWYQPGVTYFVTFRTDDSVPQAVLEDWRSQREAWLRKRGIDPSGPNWRAAIASSPDLKRAYDLKFTRQFMEYLDRGYGACHLSNPAVADILATALRHFDGERYSLGDFVVMPNHVHLLVGLHGETEIESQCDSWKSFTARKINKLFGLSGRFWQEESFDHLVRSAEQFEYLQRYIAENPLKAKLALGTYFYWKRPL